MEFLKDLLWQSKEFLNAILGIEKIANPSFEEESIKILIFYKITMHN